MNFLERRSVVGRDARCWRGTICRGSESRVMKSSRRIAATFIMFVTAAPWLVLAHAQTAAPAAPSLVQMVTTLTNEGIYHFDALELASAQANDAAWSNLQSTCPNEVCSDTSTQKLYDELHDLEDNADELLGRGETQDSLHLAGQGMAAALRWTAPEEYAAQGSLTTNFANSQVSLLSQRFAALRFAAQQVRLAQGDSAQPTDGWSFASLGTALGGAAGADDTASFSRWSVYVNGGYGSGSKQPTTFEDAFDFDSTQISAGIDLRLTNRWVVGVFAGHSEKRLNFNSELSTADGGVRGNGQSAFVYAQLEGDAAYLDMSVGVEHLSLSMDRSITYPSNNPSIPSVSDEALSHTGATSLIGTLDTGYTFHWRALSAEPYLDGQYVHTRIGSFTEHDAEPGFDFAFAVGSQSIPSLEVAAGLKLECVLSGRLGVFIPYIYGERRHQFLDRSRDIASSYAAGGGGLDFALPTDEPSRNYYVAGAGASIVLPHGFQAFAQYLRTVDYTDYTDHVVSGGIRWEF